MPEHVTASVETIAIIIPLGPDEPEWPALLDDLVVCPAGTEVIIVAIKNAEIPVWLADIPSHLTHLIWHWCTAPQGRALQLNQGAKLATARYLWFVHADSRLTQQNIVALQQAIGQASGRLYYFDLSFLNKSNRRLIINEWGAKFRSNVLGVPFGDQGLCLARQQFERLGGYRTDLAFGEDHALVWAARFNGIPAYACHVKLATSAAKYQQYGWGTLTLRYQRMWLQQAYFLICEHRKNR
jgi:hypothetical protein